MAITAQESLQGEIELKGVSFAYPQEPQHLVLQNISID